MSLFLFSSGCNAPPAPTIPTLVDPIDIVEGVFYTDGGSVSVLLRDSEGTELSVVYGQDTFPNENFQGGELYIGTIDELYDGKAVQCPMNSPSAIKVADCLERAVLNEDPSFAPQEAGYIREDRLDEPMELSAAKGLLQFLKEGIPANLLRVN